MHASRGLLVVSCIISFEMKETEISSGDEFLDVVDENDVVIGRELRSRLYSEYASNFRVVNAFVVNSNGQLWIPTRRPDKKLAPNALDFSVGGHVVSGESYDEALFREAEEELGSNPVRSGSIRRLGKLTPNNDGVAAFMQVYEIRTDKTPQYNPSDFTAGEWLYPEQLEQRIRAGHPVKSDLPIVFRRFYPQGAPRT